ncbi:DUF952 domain-containing protein [Cellulomonas hominis]|uniref:DUF952 domain-containing protein n=1 Tax=Cellulomonas hominis TaxID=156981 RepID=UPI001BA393EB|nr:DUF952 domain-containing protein [Cellulomonas hominis]VTR75995.1 hypothetical protein CHMI_00751 [Cellulomonas hominis]
MGGMRVLHVAFHDDWEGCERFGEYDVATRRTLYETEGFIHATTSTGVAAVLRDVYGDVSEPLLLAVLDEDALAEAGAAVDWEPRPGGAVPRTRGAVPMDRRTVVATLPLQRDAGGWAVPDLSGLAVRGSAPDAR